MCFTKKTQHEFTNECMKLLSVNWSNKHTAAMPFVLHSKKLYVYFVIQSFRMKVVCVL
jgi:hypothetical protein